MEIWKEIENTCYEVSNLGRVRNKKTKRIKKQHNKNNSKKEIDYKKVHLYIDGKSKSKAVHRLVAIAFIPNENNLPEVNHKNGIRNDNRAENLEWCTREENMSHSERMGHNTPKKAVVAIKGDKRIYFDSLWQAGRFIKGYEVTSKEIDSVSWNIRMSIYSKNKSAYGYKWEFTK